ncbi:MAG TPA: DUF1697 domain-containing protein [Egibacteraceae bacterium]|nr:DUF1697 domain-containing protein [Egibacteraceae bacterium]
MAADAAARWVAFLRAINVGGRRVRMDALRDLFGELGFADVATHVASGNVIFRAAGTSEQMRARIEAGLRDALGFDVPAYLRSERDVAGIVAAHPFGDVPEAQVQVAFLRTPPTAAALRALRALQTPRDRLEPGGAHLYWLATDGVGRSTLSWPKVEAALGSPTTVRSLTSLRRLAAANGMGASG